MLYHHIDDLDISLITLGTVQLGQKYGISNTIGEPTWNTSFQILKNAVKYGINSFDTAPIYGTSEKLLGSFFQKQKHLQNPIIITKIPNLNSSKKKSRDEILKFFKKSIESSLKNLQINKIPICLLHEPLDLFHHPDIPQCLETIKEEGLVGKIGVSVCNPSEVEKFLEIGIFDSIQIPLNIFDTRLITEGFLSKLRKKNTIIFARSIFLQGLFFIQLDKIPDYLQKAKHYLDSLHLLASRLDMSMDQLTLSYIRDIPEITSLIIGVDTVEQLVRNMEILNLPKLSNKTRQEISSLFKEVPEEIINPSLWN